MKITDVRAVYPKWRVLPAGAWQSHFWQIVVEVRADNGAVGYGYGGGGAPAVEIVNSHFRELLAGRPINSVSDIGETWDLLYLKSLPYGRKGIPVMALSGVRPCSVGPAGEVGGQAGLRPAWGPEEAERQSVRVHSRYRTRPGCRVHRR